MPASTIATIEAKINRLPAEEYKKAVKWYDLTTKAQFLKISPYMFGLLIGTIFCYLFVKLSGSTTIQFTAVFIIGVSIIAGLIIRKCLAQKLAFTEEKLSNLLKDPEMPKILRKVQITF